MPSDPPPPDLVRVAPRPLSRLEQRCNGPRSFSLFLLVASLMAGNGYLVVSSNGSHRVAVAIVVLLAVLAGLRTLRTGTRLPFLACLVLTAGLVALWHGLAAATAQDGWIGAATMVVDTYAIGLGVALALSAVRLLSPLKASLLGFSAATAIAIGAAFWELRDAGSGAGPAPRPEEAQMLADREFFVPNALTWLGPQVRTMPDVDYAYHPNVLIKNCYPDNPRSYFEVEEIYGLQDMRTAFLRVSPPARATLEPSRQRSGTVRVEPTECDPKEAWRLAVDFLQIPVRAGVRYTVTCRARAEQERTIRWTSFDAADTYVPSGLDQTITLEPGWREFSAVFVATRTSNKNLIAFEVGKDMAAVELTAFAIQANSPQATTMEPAHWRPAKAAASPLSRTATSLRLEPAPGRVAAVERDLAPLVKGTEYEFSLRARADGEQQLVVAVAEAEAPATSLGPTSKLALGKEWQLFGGRFTAAGNGKRPVFLLGAVDAAVGVEIADFRFASYDRGPLTLAPPRYTVGYQLNGDGFRDRDHPLEKEPGTYRIACLGDSFTFGAGVHEQDTFVRRIEAALPAGKPAKYEVMNFGVCGYSTRQERLCFEQTAAKYEPNLVLVSMVSNDNLSYEDEKKLGLHDKPAGGALLRQLRQQRSLTYEKVGYAVCVKELLALRELCRQQGARLAVVLWNRPCEASYTETMGNTIRAGLKDTDIPILDLAEMFRTMPFAVQMVHEVDGHPNELAHHLAAERIVAFLHREVLGEKTK